MHPVHLVHPVQNPEPFLLSGVVGQDRVAGGWLPSLTWVVRQPSSHRSQSGISPLSSDRMNRIYRMVPILGSGRMSLKPAVHLTADVADCADEAAAPPNSCWLWASPRRCAGVSLQVPVDLRHRRHRRFQQFFRMHPVHLVHPVQNPESSFPSGAVSSVAPNTFGQPGETGRMLRVDPIPGPR
jgi:hypothetical protein